MKHAALLLFLSSFLLISLQVSGIKVFEFNEGNNLSSATVTNALPDQFLICSSHTQQVVNTPNTRTIYVLYKDSSFTTPWLSIGFYKNNILWANIRFNYWYILGQVTRETLLYWVHICVEVDTIKGMLRASINGGNVTTVTNVQGLTPVPKLHLRLGVVHESYHLQQPEQFIGAVANVNILNKVTQKLASVKACKLNNGY